MNRSVNLKEFLFHIYVPHMLLEFSLSAVKMCKTALKIAERSQVE